MAFVQILSIIVVLFSSFRFFTIRNERFLETRLCNDQSEKVDFLITLPAEIFGQIFTSLFLNHKISMLSCSKYFYSNYQDTYAIIVSQLLRDEIDRIFVVKDRTLTLQKVQKYLENYIRDNTTWLNDQKYFVLHRYYFLTYFFKHVLMDNRVVDHTKNLDFFEKSEKKFDRLISIVHSIIKNNTAHNIDTRYNRKHYYFKIHKYKSITNFVFNPWCIMIDYGVDKKETMLFFYTFYDCDRGLSRIRNILEQYFKKEKLNQIKYFAQKPTFKDDIISLCLQKYEKQDENKKEDPFYLKFSELVQAFKKNDKKTYKKIMNYFRKKVHILDKYLYTHLYYHLSYNNTQNSKDFIIISRDIIIKLSEAIYYDIKDINNILSNISDSVTHVTIIYNMDRFNEHCMYAGSEIDKILRQIDGREKIQRLYITVSSTQDEPNINIFDKNQFPNLLPEETSVIMK